MHRKSPLVVLVALLVSVTVIGCGSPAAPQPPSLNLPDPVLNLSAMRVGNSVRLAWTMPTRTTDKVALRHAFPAQICRALADAVCTKIASVVLAPGAAGQYSDELPADLTQGGELLLRYEVVLSNHAGKAAGSSNAAYTAAGGAPPAVTGLTGQPTREGVLLSWRPANEPGKPVLLRIERLQLTLPAQDAPRSPLAAPVQAAAQTLVVRVPHGADPGHAVDASALFNQRYRYAVERVASQTLAGQPVEVQGLPSDAIVVATVDVFPPAVPQGLVAVADAAGGAIDLSWSPDSDSDLEAYRVYRRDAQGGSAAQRLASVGVETSFRDGSAQPQHTYAYSVSAVDQSGNESKACTEVEETLPNR